VLWLSDILVKFEDYFQCCYIYCSNNVPIWVTGHCNRAAVSRNRYDVEKPVDTHKILINAIKCYVCLLHTWFCLSYFLKTNINLYCIYQYFMSINSFFQHRICFSIQPPDYSDLQKLINIDRQKLVEILVKQQYLEKTAGTC
jgi:hypothetical protein